MGVQSGAILIILDSTPWSNFSIFVGQYKLLFTAIIHALSNPQALKVWGWGTILLGLAAFAYAIFRHPILAVVGGLALGVTIGSAATIGIASFKSELEGQDFGVKIVTGSSVKAEFLKQLIAPGERTFARALSALAKYDLDPFLLPSEAKIIELSTSKKWLLIQPDVHQLPSSNEVIAYLRGGGNFTVLFGPEQAGNIQVRNWLDALGLITQRAVGLSQAEDLRAGGLLSRRGPILLREIRTVTLAKQTARVKERESNALIQSYTARPTSFPPSSGILSIGFSADQFSDDAVGEIWEGIYPSSLGKLRERQLAAVLSGEEIPNTIPNMLEGAPRTEIKSDLANFVLLIDGKSELVGRFSEEKLKLMNPPSAMDDPVDYLLELRNRALVLISSSCPHSAKVTQCDVRLLGPDLIEWMVSWASKDNGEVAAVELLHERRFSGVGNTVNVVFGQ
jgi:hypothetical protein